MKNHSNFPQHVYKQASDFLGDYLHRPKDVCGKRQATSTIYMSPFFPIVFYYFVFWHSALYYSSLLLKNVLNMTLLPYLMQYFPVSVVNSKWLIPHCFLPPRNANLSLVEPVMSASSLLSTGVAGGLGWMHW